MNPRERTLLAVLLSILGAGFVFFIGYQWYYVPLTRHNAQIILLQEGVDKSVADLLLLNDERKKILEKARQRSLPPSTERAISQFSRYLQSVMREHSLTVDDLQSPTGVPVETKQIGAAALQKKPAHVTLAFQVRAKGTMPSLVAALEEMQNTPLVHRIKNLSIERADNASKDKNPRLSINMVVEAMIVSKPAPGSPAPAAKAIDRELLLLDVVAGRTGRPIGLSLLPWVLGENSPLPEYVLHRGVSKRNYEDISALNIFTGMIPYVPPPPPPPRPKKVKEEDKTPPPVPFDYTVLEYVRLVMTNPMAHEAFLRNQLVRSAEMRLRDVPGSGYDTFRITEEDGVREIFRAKVLRIEQRDLYFQVEKSVYRMHIGQTLNEALTSSLSEDQMEDLELTALYDPEFAATSAAGDTKKKSSTKKKGGR